ncbi:MAG: hypothetical protein JWP58_3280 [Hymenobacter sp.]|nr:hypothetical protein [Hymenobacter sp.]
MKKLFSALSMGVFLMALVMVAVTHFPGQAHELAAHVPHGPVFLTWLVGSGISVMGCTIVPIEAIVLDECPNPGGLTDLHVIRRRDIETFPAPGADGVTISTAIVPKADAGFVPWEFAQDTGEVNHSSGGDAGNKSIKHEVNTYVPRGSAETDAVIQSALNGDFVVIGRDSNGNLRIAGDKRRGVIFDHDYKSGKKGGDKNGTDFKFAGEGFTHVPYYYTAAIPLKS